MITALQIVCMGIVVIASLTYFTNLVEYIVTKIDVTKSNNRLHNLVWICFIICAVLQAIKYYEN